MCQNDIIFPQCEQDKLCEVVDKKNRLLCVMPFEHACHQNLNFRAVAIILRNSKNLFLKWPSDGAISFSCFHFLPYGLSLRDYAQSLLLQECDLYHAAWRKISCYEPSEFCNAFTTVFEAVIRSDIRHFPENRSHLIALDTYELKSIFERDYPVDPFFRFFLESYKF